MTPGFGNEVGGCVLEREVDFRINNSSDNNQC